MNNLNIDTTTPEEAARVLTRVSADKGYKLIGMHPYLNLEGKPILWKLRLKHAQTGEKKIFPMHIQNDGRYSLTEPNFVPGKKPLYRVVEAINNPHDHVWVTEGETCADALAERGLIAITSGGWNSAKKANWTAIKNRQIIIWPDADDVGQKYAAHVAEILSQQNCTIQCVDIGSLELKQGEDCIDWLEAHPNATKETIFLLPLIDSFNSLNVVDIAEKKASYPRFELTPEGVYYCRSVDNSAWICSWLVIKALTRDADGINWGRVLVFKDADQVERQWTMPMELLAGNGDELCKELLRLGLRMLPGGHVRKLLVEYITNTETNQRARCVLSTGWHNGSFVLPTKVFGENNEAVLFQSDNHLSPDYSSAGSILEWQNHVAAMCMGNSRLVFAASLAFAAPLLKIVREESGGFHFRGESSTGKTTTLLVAASVWGGKHFVQNWRATDNGLEGLAALHNDALLVLDELSQIDPKHAGEVAYMLANGQGKARAAKSGSAKPRLTWQLLFLSSGEISLAAHMLEAGKKAKAGQEVRMIDIPADAEQGMGIFENLHSVPNGAMFSEKLKINCDKYNGTPSEKFIEKLVATDELSLCAAIRDYETNFMKLLPESSHGQVKRVGQRFALVAAAGELATSYGVTGWSAGSAIEAAKKCFDAWINTRAGGIGSHENETTLEQVRHFFQENASRFDTFDNPENYAQRMPPIRSAGFKKSDGDYYVYPKTFSDEICKGLGSPKDVAKLIQKNGWLIAGGKDGKPYNNVWVPSQGKTVRLYHFSSKVFGDKPEIEKDSM
jgi:putative DNA primase/helicase